MADAPPDPDLWQTAAIEEVRCALADHPDVLGLVVIGSCARLDVPIDCWSDVDLVVVVRDQAYLCYFPATDWLRQFGTLYATDTTAGEDFGVHRCQYTDLRRLDFVVVAESSLSRVAQWRGNPLAFGNRVLWSRSALLDESLGRGAGPATPAPELDALANSFRFKAMLAATKVARDEMLVALHLALDLVRDCALLAMMLRDRDTGSDHHRDGSEGNRYLPLLSQCGQPYTAEGVLTTIERCAWVFDELAARCDPGYQPHRQTLLEYVAMARGARR